MVDNSQDGFTTGVQAWVLALVAQLFSYPRRLFAKVVRLSGDFQEVCASRFSHLTVVCRPEDDWPEDIHRRLVIAQVRTCERYSRDGLRMRTRPAPCAERAALGKFHCAARIACCQM